MIGRQVKGRCHLFIPSWREQSAEARTEANAADQAWSFEDHYRYQILVYQMIMEGKTTSQWKQALYVLSRIPLEIRLDIYSYTLIAEDPIQLRDAADNKTLYRWQEPFEDATQKLKRASEFYLWAAQICQHIKHEEIHDYFLGHNTFSITNKVGTDTLVKTVQDLSKAGFKTKVHGLDILIKGSKVSVEDADEGRRMLPKPKDYAKVDPGTPAFGAYRILKAFDETSSAPESECYST